MKRCVCYLLTVVILQMAFQYVACADEAYCSFATLKESLPARWVNNYHTDDNREVSIDIPIVIPDVTEVPVVRITWGGPYEYSNHRDDISIVENTPNMMDIRLSQADTTGLTLDTVANQFLQLLHEAVPSTQACHLEPYYQNEDTVTNSGQAETYYWTFYYNCFHQIPYIVSQSYIRIVDGEGNNPFNVVYGVMKSGYFHANVCTPKEIGVDAADIPLMNFEDILKIFENWVEEGYVYSLSEMRFGYMAFIDPAKKGEEFVLLTVWAAKGITRSEIGIPFHPDESKSALESTAYQNPSCCVVNAQTGQKYDFHNDVSADRRYVPHIITWDEVNK